MIHRPFRLSFLRSKRDSVSNCEPCFQQYKREERRETVLEEHHQRARELGSYFSLK